MAKELNNVNDVLKRFRDYVIQQSRSNLSKSDKNVSKELYNSLKGEIITEDNYSIVGFSMADYGQFQNIVRDILNKHSLEKDGDGIAQSMLLLKEMLDDLMRFPNYLSHKV